MYRIMNDSKRSFIVRADEVIKGGKVGQEKGTKIIPAGKAIVEVSDKLGKFLSSYKDITVVEIIKEPKGK